MTDRLRELAEQAGLPIENFANRECDCDECNFMREPLRKFAALVRRDERIACIDAVEGKRRLYWSDGEYLTVDEALDAIRALAAQEEV